MLGHRQGLKAGSVDLFITTGLGVMLAQAFLYRGKSNHAPGRGSPPRP